MLQVNGRKHPGLDTLKISPEWEIKCAKNYGNAVILGKAGERACVMVSQVDDLLADGRAGYLLHVFQETPEVVSRVEAPFHQADEFRLGYWNDLKRVLEAFSGKLNDEFYAVAFAAARNA